MRFRSPCRPVTGRCPEVRFASHRALAGWAAFLLLALAPAASGQTSEYFVTDNAGSTLHVLQTGAVQRSWPLASAANLPIAVLNNEVRTTEFFANAAPVGRVTDLFGTILGSLPGHPVSAAQFYDATSDGQDIYVVDFVAGDVYRLDASFQSPVFLFNSGAPNPLGITYDATDNTLWISDWSGTLVRQFSLGGTLLGSFSTGHRSNAALALDPADGTLWLVDRSTCCSVPPTFEQWTKTGTLLFRGTLGPTSGNVLGGEFGSARLYAAEGCNRSQPSTHLYTLDPTTGAIQQDLGDTGVCLTGLDFHPATGRLYGTTTGRGSCSFCFVEINPATAATTVINPGLGAPIIDLSFSPDGSTLYGWSEFGDDLVTINVASGVATPVADFGHFTARSALDMAPDGTLYKFGDLVGPCTNCIAKLDPATGQDVGGFVAINGSGSNFYMNAGAHDGAGVLYVSRALSLGGGSRTLATLDTTTGVLTDIGPVALPTLSALAWGGGSTPVNTPPTVTITAPPDGTTVFFGTGITFTGTAADAEDGSLTGSISWSSSLDGALGTGGSVGPVVLSIGSHTITASVTDSGGESASDLITVTVLNNPPVVGISSPASGSVFTQGALVTFTGTASDVEDGNLTGVISWSSSLDGALGGGGSVSSATLSVGTHTITASVIDSNGAPGSASISIRINAPPTVTITGPLDFTTVNLGTLLTFTGVASDIEDGDLTASIGWSSDLDGGFGTGSPNATSALTFGMHVITASVTDSDGASASDSITVIIDTNAPDGVQVGHTTSGSLRQAVDVSPGDVCTARLWVGKRADGLGSWGGWNLQLTNGFYVHNLLNSYLFYQTVEWQQYEKVDFTVPSFLTGTISIQLTGYGGWESYDLVELDCGAGDLVTNGSFEELLIPDGQWSTAFGNPPPDDWTPIGGAGHFNPNTTQFSNFLFP